MEQTGKHIIQSYQKKWQLQQAITFLLFLLSFGILLFSICFYIFYIPIWWLIPTLLIISLFLFIIKKWRITNEDVIAFLNKSYPELEESAGLLLSNQNSLNLLQQFQYSRNNNLLKSFTGLYPIRTKLIASALFFLVSVSIFLIGYTKFFPYQKQSLPVSVYAKKETVLPQITSFNIRIIAPAYTHLSEKENNQFNIKAVEGSLIQWNILTTKVVDSVTIILNDSAIIHLKKKQQSGEWFYQNIFNHSGFYQLKINNEKSELYQIEIIKDNPPVITVLSPKPNTVIDFGQPKKVETIVSLTDDYGISNAFINATTASGNGESVKFKEHKIPFNTSFNQQTNNHLQQTINLSQLEMQPGDELYFFIEATDNHNQSTRSDIYKVIIADTAQLMNLEGFANAVNIKQDYFRSQRQIIIETEQLLKDKDTITIENFKNKSNNLGIDQKLLRLRYGKYLGEENESGGEPKDIEKLDATEFGDATAVTDAFTDKHDNAEDATYLDTETKKQLKAVLNEMWAAELKLRLAKPSEALPFEYKALRLLKDLQQKQRVYVAKTSYKTPVLKLEKRLTGNLSSILQPSFEKEFVSNDKQATVIKNALAVLENLQQGSSLNIFSIETLEQAMQVMSYHAAKEPVVYLSSYNALKKIIESVSDRNKIIPYQLQIPLAEYGLQKLLPIVTELPNQSSSNTNNLSKYYFNNLKKAN